MHFWHHIIIIINKLRRTVVLRVIQILCDTLASKEKKYMTHSPDYYTSANAVNGKIDVVGFVQFGAYKTVLYKHSNIYKT